MSRFGSASRILDEHSAAGGAVKSYVYLMHPGPSLLVSALAGVAAAAIHRGSGHIARGLLAATVMLCAQCSIGVLNDVCDLPRDRIAQPYKPLVRSSISWRLACVVGVALAIAASALAAGAGTAVLLPTLGGLSAGIGYDLGLKRTPFSWIPWCGGLIALPAFVAAVADGRADVSLAAVSLAVPLAVALHCANGLPDISGDRRSGSRSLPALLGPSRCRTVATIGTMASWLLVAPLWVITGTTPNAGALVAYTAGGVTLGFVVLGRSMERPHGPLMVGSALVALSWFAAAAH